MPRVLRTVLAEQDLVEIWVRIAQDNLPAADQLLDALSAKLRLLADNPRIGRARPDLARGLRYLPVGGYLLLYRIVGKDIEIVRVVHGAREILGLL